jgi:SAM-dependent methyltransferase
VGAGFEGERQDCLAHIGRVWKNIIPGASDVPQDKGASAAKAAVARERGEDYHQRMIDVFKKRYQAGLDTWTGADELVRNIHCILDHWPFEGSGEVFEVGVGSVDASQEILERGHKLTGIDVLEHKRWPQQQRRWQEKLTFMVGDFLSANIDHKYDLVLDNGLLHHLDEHTYLNFLHKVFSIVKPGGHFAVSVFYESDASLSSGHVEMVDGGKRRCKYFTEAEIRVLLENCAFSVESVSRVPREFNDQQTLVVICRKASQG